MLYYIWINLDDGIMSVLFVQDCLEVDIHVTILTSFIVIPPFFYHFLFWLLGHISAQCEAQTHDPEIKSLVLY